MNTLKTYKPVDCHFYDLLEIAAMRRQYLDITYTSGEETLITKAFIDDLRAEHGEEFMYLHNGQKIRLDHVIQIDGNFNPSKDIDKISCKCDSWE